jgi:hypothetical protein
MFAQRLPELLGVDQLAAPAFAFALVGRIFEDQRAEAEALLGDCAGAALIDAVAVEMDDVVGRSGLLCACQLGLQRGPGRRVEQRQPGQFAERRQCFDQRSCADAVVKVGGALVLRARTEQEDAQRRLADYRVARLAVGSRRRTRAPRAPRKR